MLAPAVIVKLARANEARQGSIGYRRRFPVMARNARSMRAGECLFLVEERSYSGHPRNDQV